MDNFYCRLAEDSQRDGEAFCDLYNSFYAKKVDLSYYRWQFFRTPFTTILCTLTNCSDQPVGFYGLHITPINQQNLKVAWVLDIMIHPTVQDRGYFRQLAHFAKQQLDAHRPVGIFVMANDKGAAAHIHGMSWDKINEYISHVASSSSVAISCKSKLIFEQVGALSDDSCEAISFMNGDHVGLTCVERNARYLNWRYVENPRFKYDQFLVFKDGQVFGYLVLKSFADPTTSEKYGDVVDIAWREDDAESLAEMLTFAIQHFKQTGVQNVLVWLQTNTILDTVGREIGFYPVAQTRFFCGEILDNRYQYLSNASSWFLTLSDSEVY